MAYLGNKPATGENNAFRILDDISSHVVSFNGSSASVVSVSADTITIAGSEHRYITGQRVTYSKGGGTVITGLTDATAYYVIKDSDTTIQLATTASNANNGVAVNLTGLGAGTAHTLTLAFDGTNTKFKPTYNDGSQNPIITRAAQLVISLNGVIQQPIDSASPSTGFGIDVSGNIIFSTAPDANDDFWGHVHASNTVTFDISDNDIDNFTGDGSTANFNLSKTPPDNRNILVTLDGVIQYPSDNSNTRAYTLSENELQFVSAPASGVAIQVRHIGFAGASSGGSGGVTGFYGRTGNVVLKSTDNPVIGNLTANNIVAVDGTFSGNVSIAKTLTYMDVAHIDAVGVITAQNDVNFNGSGAGISSSYWDSSANEFKFKDNVKLSFGDSQDLSVYHTGSSGYISNTSSALYIRAKTNQNGVNIWPDGAVQLHHSGTEVFETQSWGFWSHGSIKPSADTYDLGGNHVSNRWNDIFDADTGEINIGDGGDLTIQHNATNSVIKNITGDLEFQEHTSSGNIIFKTTTSGTERLRISSAGNIGIGTNNPTQKLDIRDGNILLDAFNNSGDVGIFFRPGFTVANSNSYNLSILAYDHSGVNRDGLSLNAYDGISFCTGSNTRAEKVRIDAAGRVGIGTDNPGNTVHLGGTQGVGVRWHNYTSGNSAYHTLEAGDKFQSNVGGSGEHTWISAGATKMTLTNAGKLGINETSPGHRLTIGGDGYFGFTTPNDAARQIIFNANRGSAGQTLANINWQWNSKNVAQIRGIAGSDTTNKDDGHLAFFTSSANNLGEKLRITSGGNIQLQGGIIYGDDAATGTFKLQNTSGNSNHARIEIGAIQSSDNGGIHFYTAGSSAATRYMTLKGGGNLGIGIDNPTSRLYVNGVSTSDIITARAADANGASVINILAEGTTGISRIKFSDTAAATGDGWISYYHSDRAIAFATAGTGNERLRIDSSGRLLYGTTSSTRETSLVLVGNSNSYTTNPGTLDLFVGQTPQNLAGMGQICFGTQNVVGARIDGRADQDWNLGSARGSHIRFLTVANGSTSLAERLRISSTGQVHLNGASSSTTGTSATDLLMANGAAIRFRKGDGSAWINTVGLDSSNNLKLGWGGATTEIHFGISGIGDQMKLKSTGELRIGANTTTASTAGDDLVIQGSSDRGLSIISGTSSSGNIYFGDTDDADIGRIAYQHNDNAIDFSVNAASTRLRIHQSGITVWGNDNYFYGGGSGTNLNGDIKIRSTGTAVYQSLKFMSSDGSNQSQILGYGGGAILFFYSSEFVWGINNQGERLNLTNTALTPRSSSTVLDLGTTGNRYRRTYTNGITVNTSNTNTNFCINGGSSANVMTIRNTTLGNGNVGILFSTQDHSGGREKAAIYHQETHGGAHYGGDFIFCLNTATGSAGQVGPSDVKFRILKSGAATLNGALTQNASDIRLKENIQPIENSLEKVKSLSGFTYNWNKTAQDLGFEGKGHDELQVGLFAQDVEKVQPEVVKPAPVDENYKTIQYEKLVPLLVEAIKEQQEQIETLKSKVSALESS